MPKHAYIITGASSGLGAALARQLLSLGNQVFCLSRSENNDLKIGAYEAGHDYKFVSVDLSNEEHVCNVLQDLLTSIEVKELQSITLINNAAKVEPIRHIEHCTHREIMSAIQLNITTPMVLTSNFIRYTKDWMVKRLVVNVSSGSAQYPAPSMSVYCSTKAALNMFSQCVTLEQRAEANPVQMLVVDPGLMNTDMQNIAREAEFELAEYFNSQKDLGNLCEPDVVASRVISDIHKLQ